MFRKKKGPGETQGFNRISRLIEDRQREIGDDDAPEIDVDDDTILLRQDPAPIDRDVEADSVDTVSLLGIRAGAGQPLGASPPATPAEADQPGELDRTESDHDFSIGSPSYYREPDSSGFGGSATDLSRPMAVPDLGAVHAGASLVAVDASWEGKLRSDGDIRIEGILRGEIDTAATLVVAPQAQVHGTIRARNLLIGGDVEGDVTCEERLEILPGGSARGQINSGTLVVHEGAYIDSRFQMRRDAAEPER
ncbi:MAG: bactofilin family protein [Dehalococcoidia bacterium]